jgi:hypothetical protein
MPKTSSPAEPAPQNAYLVVGGRRWRTADPRIPDNLRQELVNALMSARRAVRDAKGPVEMRRSRRRVNDAKVALGERGHAWWLAPDPVATVRRIEAAMRALLESRKPGRTICPSDVARIVGGPTWRTLLGVVREQAVLMTRRGELEILRGGEVVRTDPTRGVLRYRLPPRPASMSP